MLGGEEVALPRNEHTNWFVLKTCIQVTLYRVNSYIEDYIYVYTHTYYYTHIYYKIKIVEKEVMNLKESGKVYMGEFRVKMTPKLELVRRKGEGEGRARPKG